MAYANTSNGTERLKTARYVMASDRGYAVYYYHRRRGFRTFPLSPGVDPTNDQSVAKDFEARSHSYAILGYQPAPPKQRKPIDYMPSLYRLVVRAKGRAKDIGKDFDLTTDQVFALMEKQEYRCVLSGFKFALNERKSSARRVFAPSIDRIDCKRGYTIDNVRLVIVAVNIGLADFGDDAYIRVCRAVAKQSRKV